MGNKQMDFMFPYPVPDGMHPYAPLLAKPLGLALDTELMNDLAVFLFDLVGVKLHDVEPNILEFFRGWDDPRQVDEVVPGGDMAAVWSPDLPSGLSLDPRTGHMVGVLPDGEYRWVVHVGPQIKFDAFGGVGSPHEDGRWIGALEDRYVSEASPPSIDVSVLSPTEREELLLELQKHNSDETGV